MDYEVARARILLRDLEHVGRGRAAGVELARSADGGPAVRGTATRLGLLRLAVRVGQAALAARSVVVVHGGGGVSEDTAAADGLVQVFLAEDPPAAAPRPVGWVEWLLPVLVLAVAALSLIGLATVVRWLAAG
jgi:hypothetical protein